MIIINVAAPVDVNTKIAVEEMAIFSCVNMLAGIISKCEFKTYMDYTPVKLDEYYLWNYEPNRNQNSVQLIQGFIARLLLHNEALMVEVNGQLLVADSYGHEEYALVEDVFTQVTCGNFTFNRSFHMSDVIYIRLNDADIQQAMRGLYKLYGEAIAEAFDKYQKSGGKSGILHVTGVARGAPTFEQDLEKLMNDRFRRFFNNKNAVLPLFDGYEYTPQSTEAAKKTTNEVSDIKTLTGQAIERAANAYKIAPQLLRGDVTNIDDAINSTLTFAVDPIIKQITNVVEWVTNVISALMALLHGDFEGYAQYVRAALQNVIDFIMNIITAIVNYIVAFLDGMGVDIKQIFTDIWNGIASVFTGIGQWFAARWTDIANAFSAAATWFQTLFQTAYNSIVNIFKAIGQWFASRWQDIQNALSQVSTWFQTIFQNAYNNVMQAFQNIGQWFKARYDDITSIFKAIPNFFKGVFEDAVKFIQNAFSGIVDFFKGIADTIGKIFGGILSGLSGLISGGNDAVDDASSSSKSSKSSLPYMATGGRLRNGGAIVAEAGPELIEMVNGEAIVTPLTGSATNTPIGGGSGGITQNNYNTFNSPKAIDPYEASRQTRNANRRAVLALQRG